MSGSSAGRGELPLSALVSQLFVAFVIECDNEFEHRMPHRTTRHGRVPGPGPRPWLVSLAMWEHCLRLVPEEGITAGELARRGQLSPKSTQMLVKRVGEWWGYLELAEAGDGAARPAPSARLIRPTPAGREAQGVWAPLTGEVEARWRDRFGDAPVRQLRTSLAEVVARLGFELPDFMPVGEARPAERRDGLFRDGLFKNGRLKNGYVKDPTLSLPALMSKVLFALGLDFEQRSPLSLGIYTSVPPSRLAISANLLRVLDDDGRRAADLPSSTGVAKMTVDNWLRSLATHGDVALGSDSGRFRLARLTPKGRRAREAYTAWCGEVEGRWRKGLGAAVMRSLRASTEALVIDPDRRSLLYRGIEPYPDGWRSQVPVPATLPHYPVVSVRGGYPDGS